MCVGMGQLTHINRGRASRGRCLCFGPPPGRCRAALTMLHRQCCASLSVLCVCWHTPKPSAAVVFRSAAPVCAVLYIRVCACAVPCCAKNIQRISFFLLTVHICQ